MGLALHAIPVIQLLVEDVIVLRVLDGVLR